MYFSIKKHMDFSLSLTLSFQLSPSPVSDGCMPPCLIGRRRRRSHHSATNRSATTTYVHTVYLWSISLRRDAREIPTPIACWGRPNVDCIRVTLVSLVLLSLHRKKLFLVICGSVDLWFCDLWLSGGRRRLEVEGGWRLLDLNSMV